LQVLIVKKPGSEEATEKMREIAIWFASHNMKVGGPLVATL